MRAIILIALLVILAVCFADVRPQGLGRRGLWRQRGQRGDREAPKRGLWRNKFNRRAPKAPKAQEESDAEFIGFLAPIAFNLIKNKLAKRDDFEEESEFINWKKVWGVAKDIGKTYLSSKYGVNLDEEEEEESDQSRGFDFGANVNNGNWNVNGAFTGQTRNGGNYNVGGNFGNGGQWGVNGGYERSWNNGNTNFGGNVGYGSGGFNAGVKFSHRFDDIEEEEADFINWKKIGGIAKDIGKTYLSSKYGINLDEEEDEEESDTTDAGSSAAAWASQQVGKGYSQSARLGPNSFDCSGLIYVAYRNQGISVPTSTHGYPGNLKRVNGEGSLRAGDILYRPGHVAMYVGGGQLVQAANPRKGVVRTPLSDYKKYWGGYTAIYRP